VLFRSAEALFFEIAFYNAEFSRHVEIRPEVSAIGKTLQRAGGD